MVNRGVEWVPKTRLGKMVVKGEITTMRDALGTGLPLREPEIVDILLPDMEDEILDVNMVQRMTDSGRRINFVITTVVGNNNGFVGLGRVKGKEVGPSIRKSIDKAKLNIIEIRRGCGSWECGCGEPHSLPFAVTGKGGSVEVTFKPAPRGVGLAVGDVAKKILQLAGIRDVWGFAKGHTKTTVNYATASFDALKNILKMRISDKQVDELKIVSGYIEAESIDHAVDKKIEKVESKKETKAEEITKEKTKAEEMTKKETKAEEIVKEKTKTGEITKKETKTGEITKKEVKTEKITKKEKDDKTEKAQDKEET
jgi:small subunit ribosomal protein S5